ncbi:MAG: alpha/beta hydrolase [Pseudomonadota bacterium]
MRPRRGYADGPFGQVHYQDTGAENAAGPPLILLHQSPMTSRQYDNVYPLLAGKGLRAVGIDTAGFGLSDPPPTAPTIEDYATVVPAVLDHLGLEQVDVLGHHTGAMIATEVAIQYPERVRRVVLNGPAPLDDEERADYMQMVEDLEKGFTHHADGSHLLNLYTRRYDYAGAGTDPELVTRYVIEQLQGFGPFWYGHHAAFVYDHAETMPNITQPTMILTNTGDVIFDHAHWSHRIRPDFELKELEGGTTDIVDQASEAWVDAVVEFLRRD